MRLLKSIWSFFGTYQSYAVRLLHLFVLILVLIQIIISNWMSVSKTGLLPITGYRLYFTWLHIGIGISLLFLALLFVYTCFSNRGVRYFYPYLWGDIAQIGTDIKLLMQFKLPESTPKGLAPCVQGLGLGALMLVVLSGFTWFVLWLQDSSLANEARNIHKTLTGLIEAYIIGHGLMGLIHFILWYKNKK